MKKLDAALSAYGQNELLVAVEFGITQPLGDLFHVAQQILE